ncbi:DNA topoisomerase 2-binding protein 1 [Thecamonas trahens ATCC 50062]|uniref:DNA topoisomerase 2-binding protein 1 n=1 Tax=Thecamonas trahens ATCC 50062 TaxID=461836 RepID=A0A0L0D0Q3_THETB|nr:DNA topoisomerase 2-binding protein 1 [Thecamonas trahens ATCC 50062]KNC45954.1 DNA topoisomerase 2-binding protein 1 [Thecamonas trahens ATCC 50062]|eukprot:XP_013762935.1 DNA topoisomerase 2-binding protein 1 [Thecamonas trahens ATCC 50062]
MGKGVLHNVVVCCTGLDQVEKGCIHKAVSCLASVTHLVADRVGSDKYRAALSISAAVVTKQWVLKCKADGRRVPEAMYALPPLAGLVICVTQLDADDRDRIRSVVSANGGDYMRNLVPEATHLLALQPSGTKYEKAGEWNVRVVSPAWLDACIKARAAVDETPFAIAPPPGVTAGVSLAAEPVDELASGAWLEGEPPFLLNSRDSPVLDKLDGLLDGRNVFLHKFGSLERRRMTRIVLAAGGHVVDEPDSSVINTWVVPRLPSADELDAFARWRHPPRAFVSGKWLWVLAQSSALPDIGEFTLATIASAALPPPTPTGPTASPKPYVEPTPTPMVLEPTPQTLPESGGVDSMLDLYSGGSGPGVSSHRTLRRTISQSLMADAASPVLFGRSQFVVDDRVTGDEVLRAIRRAGGALVPSYKALCSSADRENCPPGSRIVARYVVLPHGVSASSRSSIVASLATADVALVTPDWVLASLAANELVDITSCPLFTPLPVALPLAPRSDVVVSVTGCWPERDAIRRMAVALGATFEERLSRRVTVLVCEADALASPVEPASKIAKALRWGVSLVHSGWLRDSLWAGSLLDSARYAVGKASNILDGVCAVIADELQLKGQAPELERLLTSHGATVARSIHTTGVTHYIEDGESRTSAAAAAVTAGITPVSSLWVYDAIATGTLSPRARGGPTAARSGFTTSPPVKRQRSLLDRRRPPPESPTLPQPTTQDLDPAPTAAATTPGEAASALQRLDNARSLSQQSAKKATPRRAPLVRAPAAPVSLVALRGAEPDDFDAEGEGGQGREGDGPGVVVHYRHRDEDDGRRKRGGRKRKRKDELVNESVDSLSSLLHAAGTIVSRNTGSQASQGSTGSAPSKPRSPPIFLLTGFTSTEKEQLVHAVSALGGRVLVTREYDPGCSHILVGSPTRSEKFLGGCAAGKWMMKAEYIEASTTAGEFVAEEPYEWGAEYEDDDATVEHSDTAVLALCGRRWRKYLATRRRAGGDANIGPFTGWKVALSFDEHKRGGIKRLLEAGNASVHDGALTRRVTDSLTHVFFGPTSNAAELRRLPSHIKVLSMEYIADYLTAVPGLGELEVDEDFHALSPEGEDE